MKNNALKNHWPGACVFAVTFAVYLYTLCPTVYWDDAGELIAACYTLGIPHPPGHPLYAILGKLFTLIPIGSPAMRVNLMSAFFGALTCAVLFHVVRELIEREEDAKRFGVLGGMIAAFSASFSLIMWDQSVVAETTTMHSFFMMLVTLLAFRIDATHPDDSRTTKRLLLFSFIYGLSFTNHVAGLFFAPSLTMILVYRLRSRILRPSRLAVMGLLFALGLSVYAYLPIASRWDPPVDWGNPETFANFWWVVTASQYSSDLVRVPTVAGLIRGFHDILITVISNVTLAGCLIAAIGAARLWKTRKQIVVYGAIVAAILFATSLNSAFISVYLLPAVLMLAMWAGFGAAAICSYVERVASRIERPWGFVVGQSARAACILLPLILLVIHFSESDMRNYTHAREYGKELLSSLPRDAVLITGTADPLFIAWYLQYCEGYRTDVKVISRNALRRPGYLDQVQREHPDLFMPGQLHYESGSAVRPAFLSGRDEGLLWYANSYFRKFYDLNSLYFHIFWEGIEPNQLLIEKFEPCGLVFRINPPAGKIDSQGFELRDAKEVARTIQHDPAAGRIYGNHFFNYGLYCQWYGNYPLALRYYEDALKLCPEDTRPLNNIGAILVSRGKTDEAFEIFLRAFHLNPNDATSNHNVGQILLDRGNIREATSYFQRAIALDPGNFEDYHNLGVCYSTAGDNAKGVQMFKKALEIRPGSAESLTSLGIVYLRLGETENADKLLNAAVKTEPNNAENWYNLSCLQAARGDESASARSLKKALKLNHKRVYALASKDSLVSPILASLAEIN